MVEQNINEPNDCPCLARASCHDKKCLSAIALIKCFTNRFDCGILIISVSNGFVDNDILERGALCAKVEKSFKISLGINTAHFSFGIIFVI